jgi:hypothetical protein
MRRLPDAERCSQATGMLGPAVSCPGSKREPGGGMPNRISSARFGPYKRPRSAKNIELTIFRRIGTSLICGVGSLLLQRERGLTSSSSTQPLDRRRDPTAEKCPNATYNSGRDRGPELVRERGSRPVSNCNHRSSLLNRTLPLVRLHCGQPMICSRPGSRPSSEGAGAA